MDRMAASRKPESQKIGLRHPHQYIHSCMANRFAVDHDDGFALVRFGLINSSDLLIDQIACVFTEHTLKAQEENLVQFSDKIGLPKKRIPIWNPPIKGYAAENPLTLPV